MLWDDVLFLSTQMRMSVRLEVITVISTPCVSTSLGPLTAPVTLDTLVMELTAMVYIYLTTYFPLPYYTTAIIAHTIRAE